MFQLSSNSIVQFSSLMIYIILIPVIIFYGKVRLKKLFALFLITSAGLSLSSLFINLSLPYEQLAFWKILVPLFSSWSIVAYAHFIATFINRGAKTTARIGYGWLVFTSILIIFGYFTQGLALLPGDIITKYYGQILHYITLTNGLVPVVIAIPLIRGLRDATDPEERNRIAYLLAGLSFIIAVNIFSDIFQNTNYTLYHIGHTGNAILITYTMLKYRLLNIQLVMKKWLVYTGVTVCATLAYLALLLVLSNLLRLLPPYLGIPATIVMVILFAYLFNWLKSVLDKGADRLFYGNRYIHRQMLLSFAGKMSNFINMKEIADALLGPLAKAVRAKQTSLLLPVNDYYAASFVARLFEVEQVIPFMLQRNSLLTRWLENEGKLILREDIENNPEFTRLSPEDRRSINEAKIELICPIVSKRKLVGILALSERQPHGHYSRDDIDLVSMLAKESAVAIENAQLYSSAKEQADTDGLTGLRNHRYFQERLNQEIEKCSRSSDVFSLLFLDLDFFKMYNDTYGHVLGDEIIKEVGHLIKNAIRATDVGARYGGDEFAAILFQTSLDGALKVAERIRRRLESSMDQKGIKLTCSIGIACWRIDGIMREQIIQAADKALYCAKQAGGNRIYLASKLDTAPSALPETMQKLEINKATLSMVYALAATVDARDHYTYGHSKAVSKYATDLAEAMGYQKGDIERIREAALLHDIGKLHLPDNILTKEAPLTDEEWEMMRQHPDFGVSILKHIDGLEGCLDAVLFHHERYDGKGYPRRLKGNDIPLDARIMAIADAYDAMTSERCYKEKIMSEAEALQELERCAGMQFDPALVNIFIGLRQQTATPDRLYQLLS